MRGDTGTGKELLARRLHAWSARSGAFVAIHGAELRGRQVEAALFGRVAGAFDGAQPHGTAGLLASADGGTLLLDEVSLFEPAAQAALLRFLDDRTVRPVGATAPRPVDVQLLATTSADLEAEVAAGRFRADLLYRLATVCVELPPLRRRSDLAACVAETLRAIDAHASITPAAVERLAGHAWPGNFRELRAVLTRALLLHPGGRIDVADLPAPASPPEAHSPSLRRSANESVLETFRRTGSISETARTLQVSRTTVYRHLRESQGPPQGSVAGRDGPD